MVYTSVICILSSYISFYNKMDKQDLFDKKKQISEQNLTTKSQNSSSQNDNKDEQQQKSRQKFFYDKKQLLQNKKFEKSDIYGQDQIVNLFEGCFIIQKNLKHEASLKFYHPENLMPENQQLFNVIRKYTFNEQYTYDKIDQEDDSRLNQIRCGSKVQHIFFGFQDPNLMKKIPFVFKQLYSIPKKYVHAVIKQEVLQMQDGQKYETQIMFGFISYLPLKDIFIDLNKSIAETFKFYKLKNDLQASDKRQNKYNLLASIMKKIKGFELKKFPIIQKIQLDLMTIEIKYESASYVRQIQQKHLNWFINQFSNRVLAHLVVNVLSERNVMLVCNNRNKLNTIFQVIRLCIYPLNWLFPIVYSLNSALYPMLQSPMPVLIGCLTSQFEKLPSTYNNVVICLDNSILCQIYNETKQYEEIISSLERRLDHEQHKGNKAQAIRVFIAQIIQAITTGVLNRQPSNFHIQFIDTQMYSYYKQTQKAQLGVHKI